MQSVHPASRTHGLFIIVHLARILTKMFCLIRYWLFWSLVRGNFQVLLSLYSANRVISKVCLQIIFVCGSETGLQAWVRKIHVGKYLFQSRTGLLILFSLAARCIWEILVNKYKLWWYIKCNKNVWKSTASQTTNFQLCKFPCMHLTRFQLD